MIRIEVELSAVQPTDMLVLTSTVAQSLSGFGLSDQEVVVHRITVEEVDA